MPFEEIDSSSCSSIFFRHLQKIYCIETAPWSPVTNALAVVPPRLYSLLMVLYLRVDLFLFSRCPPSAFSSKTRRTAYSEFPFTHVSLHFTSGFVYTGTLIFSHHSNDLSPFSSLYPSLDSLHDEIQEGNTRNASWLIPYFHPVWRIQTFGR